MAYLTFDYLKENRNKIVRGIVLHDAFEKSASSMIKVFLSHRHSDKSIAEDAVGFLTEFNTQVYIDVYDYSMPDKTDGSTAKRIKQKIYEASKFILMATPKSLESKWIPWELGLGDAMKGLNNVAILPILQSKSGWPEREYYQIYGTIKNSDQGNWFYFPPNKNGIRLENWLSSKSLLQG